MIKSRRAREKGLLSGCLGSVYTSMRAGAGRRSVCVCVCVCVCNFSTGAIRAHWGKNSGNKLKTPEIIIHSLGNYLKMRFSQILFCVFTSLQNWCHYTSVFCFLFFVFWFVCCCFCFLGQASRLASSPTKD